MLHDLGHGLWAWESVLRLGAGFYLPTRSVVARLDDGTLWMHSPLHLHEEDAEALDALGTVRHIVAPSAMHHLGLNEACRRWPDATLWIPDALARKRPDLAHARRLSDAEGGAVWGTSLHLEPLRGAPRFDEWVCYHAPTQTLLCADLFFHVVEAPGWLTPWILRATGTWGKLAMSRVWRAAVQDPEAFRSSLDAVLAWAPARLLPGHGAAIHADATARLTEAMAGWRASR
ncbi:MAG: hypothetical protein RLZZ383_1498 [Pseudomonadota bacterium]|jgi:hypothetical protein